MISMNGKLKVTLSHGIHICEIIYDFDTRTVTVNDDETKRTIEHRGRAFLQQIAIDFDRFARVEDDETIVIEMMS